MHTASERRHASHREYLASERTASCKHEYLDGVVYAVAGGTPEHSQLAANVIRILGTALASRPCAVFTSDLRVRIEATGLSTYPDVTVVCGPLARAAEDPDAVTNPTMIVEVLSEGTEGYDRGEKFAHYRRAPSLREYVLVSQSEPHVEVFARGERGRWTLTEARASASRSRRSRGSSRSTRCTAASRWPSLRRPRHSTRRAPQLRAASAVLTV